MADKFNREVYCGACQEQTSVMWIDEGIGWTEAWGIKQCHHDWVAVSTCCQEGLFLDTECTDEYNAATDWEIEYDEPY